MSNIIIEQLRSLRLTEFSNVLEMQRQQPNTYNELSFEERLTLMLESELLSRDNNKINRLKKQARFRLSAQPEKLEYHNGRDLDKSQCAQLLTGIYLKNFQNILITGPTGSGKTFLACALGEQACRESYRVRYFRLNRLLDELAAAKLDGSYNHLCSKLKKINLLILDDWGLDKLNTEQARELLEVIEDRYGNSSTIMLSQLPVDKWHALIENPTVADALLDRIIHNSHRIALKGESIRKKNLT